ncbi:hypothetical protein Kpol_478p17 [Vanderwaltozyma polyspora DSM 70294]|uniref:Acyl-CoA desaturase n=1 Tax=Vanderwaltozyma polyspora (strain ATCC 22028 / DSM 70294 / BCRC 21397 / CBS 2163 / NBRC 10782 / NRRL Y-8283 / UCD 57-17) TaxID=436907 RepID=A7TPN6_VANPO|nr:uncharacterized protein Kpol_478p17 [Vanderwaltozyma polyspora DSM 70294]EDO15781.1 hypothetical protein Kpol_478p17 [Vanderwaltozyma polyspora DSM 70294]
MSTLTQVESLDVSQANVLAQGLNKKNERVVNGFGSLMGSKEMVDFNKPTSSSSSSSHSQPQSQSQSQKHISEQPWTFNNWHNHINWLNMVLVVFIPTLGWITAFSGLVPLHRNTLLFAAAYYVLGGVCVTAGYHRLWSHRAYSARWPLRLFFGIFGSASVQGSIKWWGHSHRIHHRYTDTPRDPYDARQGLWYSHMGWMLVKPNPKYKARADIQDLNDDWIVRFQHRHYVTIMIITAFVIPSLVTGYFFNDYLGGFLYAGILRVFAIQQATFCINSMAHYIGAQPFDDKRTPRDNWMTAIVTFGEGYHNFHHEFPSDYRNAIKWYQYDPTKMFIYANYIFGMAFDLKKFSQNAIEQALIQQQQKKIDAKSAKLNWGPRLTDLPVWSKDQFLENLKSDPELVVISGVVHNVKNYINDHPGGKTLIKSALGKDATSAFNGGVYRHSNAAQNVLADFRVALLDDGKESALKLAAKRGEHYYDEKKSL